VVGLANVISHIGQIKWLEELTKPLLLPFLILWFIYNRTDRSAPEFTLTLTALLLSWFGDILLMFGNRGEQFFVLGLISFLLAHLFYIVTFRYIRVPALVEAPRGFINVRIIILVMAGSSLYYLLYPNLGQMRWPVGIYTMVIISMAIAALLRRGHTSAPSFISVYAGALLFVLSDSVIAVTKFLTPVEYGGAIVMVTYLAAQFLIVRGVMIHNDPKPA
jgi:uncharacterized membrane protein YhhN